MAVRGSIIGIFFDVMPKFYPLCKKTVSFLFLSDNDSLIYNDGRQKGCNGYYSCGRGMGDGRKEADLVDVPIMGSRRIPAISGRNGTTRLVSGKGRWLWHEILQGGAGKKEICGASGPRKFLPYGRRQLESRAVSQAVSGIWLDVSM